MPKQTLEEIKRGFLAFQARQKSIKTADGQPAREAVEYVFYNDLRRKVVRWLPNNQVELMLNAFKGISKVVSRNEVHTEDTHYIRINSVGARNGDRTHPKAHRTAHIRRAYA